VLGHREPAPRTKEVFLLGWTGMRGVLALAAAISLPEYLNSGQPFPQRNLILFLTFSIILTTLVLQGLTLPAIIRKLRIGGAKHANSEMTRAQRAMLEAALVYLDAMKEREKPNDEWIVDDLIHHYRQRLNLVKEGEGDPLLKGDYREYRALSNRLRAIERVTLTSLYNQNEINDEVLRELERELDLQEARFVSAEITSGTH
jgi:monovalent cation/hydrogen antiporter